MPHEAEPVLRDAYVLVEDTKIKYVGTAEPQHDADCEIVDGTRRALLPAFINAHTHLPMTALRGYADGVPLASWLNDWIFPAEDRLNARAVKACTDLALAELAASGTVSASDMYMFCDTIAKCSLNAGMKLNVARGMLCFEDSFDFASNERGRETTALYNEWHNASDGLIRVDACIHGEYTSNPNMWRAVADFASERGIRIHLHLSETKSEHDGCVERRGVTPTRALYDAGVFRNPVTAAHGVWLTDEDMAILAESGAAVVHNPVSNLKLASGIARVPAMMRAGITVALGTDGSSSNDSLDLFEEIKLSSMLHRAAALDAALIPPIQALGMATMGGAAAQGREGETGRIAEGYDADLTVISLDRPALCPEHSLVSNLVYCARGSDVYMTLCRGKTLYRAGEWLTIDVERAMYETEHYAAPLVSGKL